LELSASKTADELEIDYGVVHRKFMSFRDSLQFTAMSKLKD